MSPPRLLHSIRPLVRRPLSLQQSILISRHTRTPLSRSLFTAADTSLPQPKPPLYRRLLSTTTRALFFTTLGFIIAMAPAASALDSILHPVSDAESLGVFVPEDPESQEIESLINSLPLAQSLRQNPDFTESRPHMKLPPAWRAHNLTAGTLLGPGRVTVPPLAFAEAGGKSYVQIFHVGSDLCGHVGIVHGGFLATVLDEGLARCCFAALPHGIGLTAKLEINYKAPAYAEQVLVLRATTTKVEGRKAWVEGHIETLAKEGEEPTVLATASALYISPKGAEKMAKVYSVQ
ncbi:Thioesterase/thiol ester dehydrase-isomerase [Coniochaeta sp. PMI_546]|nr:Thioesterase/thiol ester dehydrase-isomerase [Coniochaeta sp. PMI_546]